jgi:TonB family protein
MIFLAESIMRSSLLLAIGLLAIWLLRKQPASLRHWLLAATVILAAAQPAIHLVVPSWRLPSSVSPPMSVTSVDRTPGSAETALEFEFLTPSRQEDRSAWARMVVWTWAAGAVGGIGMLLCAAGWLWRLGRRAITANDAWTTVAGRIRDDLQITAPVRIAVTDHPALLVTWGVLNPVILLPAGANSWPADRIEVVLAHEMAHIVRRDWITQVAAEILRAIYWFNPLFWIACARLRSESEYACDDVVLGLGAGRTSYADHLVALARTFSVHGRTWLPAPSIARPSTLERRVRAMLNPHLDRRPVTRLRRLALAALLVCAALPIAAASQAPGPTTGRVVDPSNKPLPDAVVRLTSMTSDAALETRSDATGSFTFGDVPAGDYMLSARVPGFSSQRQRIQLRGAATISLQLQVGTLMETITVTSGPSGVSANSPRSVTTATSTYSAPACGNTDVGGNIRPPKKIRDVRPRFKTEWASNNIAGTVLLQAFIGLDGRVRNVEVVSGGHAELEEEAIAAVGQWEFTPTYLNCEAIEVRMFATILFKADQ